MTAPTLISIISCVCTVITVFITMGKVVRSNVTKDDLDELGTRLEKRFDQQEAKLNEQQKEITDLTARIAVCEFVIKSNQ